jgi:hypothetical protein
VYEIFAVRDQTGKNWVLGLKEMVKKSWNCFSDAALSDIVFFILQIICCPNLVVEEVSISLIIDFNVSKHDCDDSSVTAIKVLEIYVEKQ